ncbi:MAG: cytochrome c1 [Rhodobacterales bacterium CG2_30_65_12]|nr:MAG: cytochrome c1 [Rhodobacterales bacterium CG2_30_65_12]
MIRQLTLTAITAMALGLGAGAALASGGEGNYGHVEDRQFSFEGPFGKYDQMQLQRGLKVYTEVCAACHGLRYVPIRALADPGGPGYTEDEVRAYAAENFTVFDPELDDDRDATPADHFPRVTGDGMGPDLSLVAKGRAGFHGPYGTGMNQLFKGIGGAEYITAYLLGFTGEENEVAGQYLYENMAFPTGWVQMPPQLEDDLIEYDDGTPATAEQMAEDVSAFLMWAAEPKMMARKQAGAVAVLLLVVLSSLLYLANKKLWYPVKHGGKEANL